MAEKEETELPLIGGKPKQKQNKGKEIVDTTGSNKESPPSQNSPLDFGDGSRIIFDWTMKSKGCISCSVDQKEDVCWAIVLARILQAIYNVNKLPVEHFIFSYGELVSRLKKKNNVLSVGSLKQALTFVATEGLMKMPDTFGKKISNKRISQEFVTAENVSEDFIINLLEKCPVGLVLDLYGEELLKSHKDVYTVVNKRSQEESNGAHAVMITGYGETKDKKKFLIYQNSWGEKVGDRGFGRLALNGGKWDIFYPILPDT